MNDYLWDTVVILVVGTALGVGLTYCAPARAAEDCTPGWCQTFQGENQDRDGWLDAWDNCIDVPNRDQRDTDGDGIGNACDADLNQSGKVTVADYTLLRNRLGTADPDADLDGSGTVTVADYTILRGYLNLRPGPYAASYVTLGGNTYNQVSCNYPPFQQTCDPAAPFDTALNAPYLVGSVPAGRKCYPIAEYTVPTGVVGGRWGLAALTAGQSQLTVCLKVNNGVVH